MRIGVKVNRFAADHPSMGEMAGMNDPVELLTKQRFLVNIPKKSLLAKTSRTATAYPNIKLHH
jgi:hypothetical protein